MRVAGGKYLRHVASVYPANTQEQILKILSHVRKIVNVNSISYKYRIKIYITHMS